MSELKQVENRIRDWQTELGYSVAEMVRQFGGLGSERTFRRIMDGDYTDADASRWTEEWMAVWTSIEMMMQSEEHDDPIYDDLTTVLDLRRAVADVIREKGNNRLILVQGPSGSGKTKSARMLAAKYGTRVVYCEADETWKESINAMLSGILKRLGVSADLPPAAADKLSRVIRLLNGDPLFPQAVARRCLVIDEAHHLGPKTMNVVKTILNQTPGEIVLLAMGTLWRRLEMPGAAYEEAKQLTLNRMSERIRFDGVDDTDVARLVERRLGLTGADAGGVARTLAAEARQFGNLNFVVSVCRRARRKAGKDAVTADHVAKAVAAEKARR